MHRCWMVPNNARADEVVKDYPNLRLADWAATSNGHRDWFRSDQVHVYEVLRATRDAPLTSLPR